MLSEPKDFKEQMVEARRTQILLGAAQVFAEKGYYKATTREIAKSAGVSEGTIYNYFENKRELLFALIELIGTQSLKTVFLEHQADDPRDFLKAILLDRYRLLHDRGSIMAPIVAEVFTDAELRQEVYQKILMPLISFVERYIQHGIESGVFRQVNPVIFPRALIGAMGINGALKLTGLDPRYETISPEEMIDQIVTLFLEGLLLAKQQ